METRVAKDEKTGIKTLETDKRTISKVNNPPNVKTLRYSRVLPPECNQCPYRPEEAGGTSDFTCEKYEEDATCIIRADFGRLVDKFDGERNADKVLHFLQAEFENNFEKLAFFEQIEDMSGVLDPEVTRRQNSMTNMAKSLNEMRTRRESVKITQTETLSDDMIKQVTKVLDLTKEVKSD